MAFRVPRLDMSGLVRTLAQDRDEASHLNDMDQRQAMMLQGQTQGLMNQYMDDEESARRRASAKDALAAQLAARGQQAGAEGARRSGEAQQMRDALERNARLKAESGLLGTSMRVGGAKDVARIGRDGRIGAARVSAQNRPEPARKETPEERLKRDVINNTMRGANSLRSAGAMSGRVYNDAAATADRGAADEQMSRAMKMLPPELRAAFQARMDQGQAEPEAPPAAGQEVDDEEAAARLLMGAE